MEQPLNVYGVYHATTIEKKPWWTFGLGKPRVVPTKDVQAMNTHFEKLARKGVTKMGCEYLIGEHEKGYDDTYFLDISRNANSKGIKLIGLEATPKAEALKLLHGFMSDIIANNSRVTSEFLRHKARTSAQSRGFPKTGSAALNIYYDMVHTLAHYFRYIDPHAAQAIRDISVIERSKDMVTLAKEKGLKHIIVGATHGYDLKLEGHNTIYVNSPLKRFPGYAKSLAKRLVLDPESPYHHLAKKLRKCA